MSLAPRDLKRRWGAADELSFPSVFYPTYPMIPPLSRPGVSSYPAQPHAEELEDDTTREQMEKKMLRIVKWITNLPNDWRHFEHHNGPDGAREAETSTRARGLQNTYSWPGASTFNSVHQQSYGFSAPGGIPGKIDNDEVSVSGNSLASSISSVVSIPMSDLPSSSSKTSAHEHDCQHVACVHHSHRSHDIPSPFKKRRSASVASYPDHQLRLTRSHLDLGHSGRGHRHHLRGHRVRVDAQPYADRVNRRRNKRLVEERALSDRLHDERRKLVQKFEGSKGPFMQDLQVHSNQTLQPQLHFLEGPKPILPSSLTLPPIRSSSFNGAGLSASTTPMHSPLSPTSSPICIRGSASPTSWAKEEMIRSHEQNIARLRSLDHQSRAEHERRTQAMQDAHQTWLKGYFERVRSYEDQERHLPPPVIGNQQPSYGFQVLSPAASAPPSNLHPPPGLQSFADLAGQPMPVSSYVQHPPQQQQQRQNQTPQLLQRHSIAYIPMPSSNPHLTSGPPQVHMPQPRAPCLSMLNPNRKISPPVHYHLQHHHHHYMRQPFALPPHPFQQTDASAGRADQQRAILPPLQVSSLQHFNSSGRGSLPTSPNVSLPFPGMPLTPLASQGSLYGAAPRTA